jgi:hypothetical protein
MTHPLVAQLRFTRSEFKRGLIGLTEAEACQRFLPMNCISWNVGHLAWQEQRYFLFFAQNQMLLPQINAQFATGAPASTPPLHEMWTAWDKITRVVDPWLEAVTIDTLQNHVVIDGQVTPYIFGSLLQRVIYHYWYHTGENQAIRQMLGHTSLPVFVGDIDAEAPFRTV